jgi:protease-4
MAFNHTISSILRGRWFIDKRWADAHLPLIASMLQGNPVSFVERTGSEGIERPFAIDPATMQRHEMYVWVEYKGYVANPNIPDNSVAILPISGPITKYNGECGEPGALQRNSWLLDMKKRSNIGSVVLMLDTPGGEVGAQNASVGIVKNMGKPVLSYVDGMCASLGIWYSSVSDECYLSDETDEMGSVGTLARLMDFSGYFEKLGIKMHEIYAPQSTDKNGPYRDALKGDYTALEEDLSIHVDKFISFVKNNRGELATSSVSQWGTGKMFYAKDAIKIGLADGIKPFDQVISKAAWLAKRKRA